MTVLALAVHDDDRYVQEAKAQCAVVTQHGRAPLDAQPVHELGPQYSPNQKVALGGERRPPQPVFVRGRPSVDQYTFGLRVSA